MLSLNLSLVAKYAALSTGRVNRNRPKFGTSIVNCSRPCIFVSLALLMLFVASSTAFFPVMAVCETGPSPEFTLDASPDNFSLLPGSVGTSKITVTSVGGFAGDVSLSAISDTDVSATIDPNSVPLVSEGSASSTLTLAVDPFALPGFQIVTIEGTSGLITDLVAIYVSVMGPSFEMSADPDSLTVEPGGTNTSTVTISSLSGFEDTVDLTTTVYPVPAFAATLTPDAVFLPADENATSLLTIETSSSTAPGFYSVIVEGSTGFFDSTSVTILVFVTGPGFIITTDDFFPIIPAGGSKASTVTVTGLEGFSDNVDLSASSVAGISASFAPASVVPPLTGNITSVMTVMVEPTVPPSVYPMHIIGTSSSLTNSIVIYIQVPGFSMEASPDALTVEPGTSGTSKITLASLSSFSGNVTLSASSIDPCIAAVLSLGSVELSEGGTGSSTLTVTVDAATPPGPYTVFVDGFSGFSFNYVVVSVSVPGLGNSPPVLGPVGDKTVEEETKLSFTATATDLNSDLLTFYLEPGAPSGASISPIGAFTWTPSETQQGTYSVTVTVSDGDLTDSETIAITVLEANKPPVLATIGDRSVQVGTPLSFSVSATDTDIPVQFLSYSLSTASTGNYPDNAEIGLTGGFSWTPSASQLGLFSVKVTVSDGTLSDSEEFSITVSETPVNNPPVLGSVDSMSMAEGSLLTFPVTATDPDSGQTVTLSATSLPPGATFSGGVFSWTPTEAQGPGPYTVSFTATDNGSPAMSDSESIVVTVTEVNQAPALGSLQNRSVEEGSNLAFTVTASDADVPLNTLSYALGPGAPTGATISSSGAFSWTPTADQDPGTYTITVIVSDGPSSDTKSFTVTVTEVQRAPAGPAPFYEQYWYLFVIIAAVAGILVVWRVMGGIKTKVAS